MDGKHSPGWRETSMTRANHDAPTPATAAVDFFWGKKTRRQMFFWGSSKNLHDIFLFGRKEGMRKWKIHKPFSMWERGSNLNRSRFNLWSWPILKVMIHYKKNAKAEPYLFAWWTVVRSISIDSYHKKTP